MIAPYFRKGAALMPYKVIDVSEWNGWIDWDEVSKHIDGAIIRCGYGNDEEDQDDDYWERNVSECERLGIPFGVYLYSYAENTDMALPEARHAIRLCSGHNLSYPLYFDTEQAGTEWVSKDCAVAFCESVKAAGYVPGVYTFRSWFTSYMPGFDDYTIWIADFGPNTGYPNDPPYIGVGYDAWQYTSVGSVQGIDGNVDMSEFYIVPEGGAMKVDVANVAATIHANMCNDARFGYSWEPRWGTDGAGYATWEIDGLEYTVKCGDYDCSSSIITAWSEALRYTAYKGALDGATYTGNMRSVFSDSGLFEVWNTATTYAVRGDVYLNDANHTAMCQDGGDDGVYGYDCLSEFAINEQGGTYGGQTGDQTGYESYIHGFYEYPWDVTLHYNHRADFEKQEPQPEPEPEPEPQPQPVEPSDDARDIARACWAYVVKDDPTFDDIYGEGYSQSPNGYNVLRACAYIANDARIAAESADKRLEHIESMLSELLEKGLDGECKFGELLSFLDKLR